MNKLQCTHCGQRLPASAKLCPRCHGQHFQAIPLSHPAPAVPQKAQVTPAVATARSTQHTASAPGNNQTSQPKAIPGQVRILSRSHMAAFLLALTLLTFALLRTTETLAGLLADATPLETEHALVASAISEIQAKALAADHPDSQWISQLGNRLVSALPEESPYRPHYHFHVIESPEINAFAMPGGAIFVYSGLLDMTQRNPAYMAAVLAHEIQHVEHRHGLHHIYQSVSLASATLWTFGYASDLGLLLTQALAGTRYSRQLERQADAEGARLLEAAGFQRHDMAAMLRLLSPSKGSLALPSWISSHPDPEERATAIDNQR